MPELQDVTASVFRTSLAPNNIPTLSALDGDRAPTLSARQTDLSRECASLLFPVAQRIAVDHPEAGLEPVPTFYGLLNFVIEAIARILFIPEEDRVHYVDAVSALDEGLEAFVRQGDLADLVNEIARADALGLAANLDQSREAVPDIDQTAMRNLLEAGRREVVRRLESIAHWEKRGSSSRAMVAYLDIDRATARFIADRNDSLERILARVRHP
jgi:hypothetical protein